MSGSGPLREEVAHDAKSNALHSMAQRIGKHFPSVPLVSSSDLKRILDDPHRKDSIVIVDARSADEIAVSIIPGALTIDEYDARRQELSGKTVICYCTVGYRSSGHAQKLRGQGIEAKNLEGGIVRWAQKRFPLVDRATGQETKRIHVYSKPWALQPDDYEAVQYKSPFISLLRQGLPAWLGGKK